ncbi:hypothetical protein [Paenibacillus massiliensis]|uniref:hypothetical protein n=1 Tax=Paenibacillus massiliensis TaxID=225917 RepID=UPI0004711A6B|nr:hypothetical protein [Paenibacillus massiliensis]
MIRIRQSNFIIFMISLLGLLLIFLLINNVSYSEKAVSINTTEITPTYAISQGQGIVYNSFSELDQNSEIVVKGRKVKEEKVILTKNEEGLAVDKRTLSSFTIEKVLKNEKNLSLSEGQEIIIQENAARDGDIVISSLGYQLMNEGEEYLLFLRSNLTEKGVYNIRGVYYGKVPAQRATALTTQADVQFKGSREEQAVLQAIFDEALARYNK